MKQRIFNYDYKKFSTKVLWPFKRKRFLYTSLVALSILLAFNIFYGVILTIGSGTLYSQSAELREYAIEDRIESTDMTDSAGLTVSGYFNELINQSLLDNLKNNESNYSTELVFLKQALGEVNNSTSLDKEAIIADNSATKSQSQAVRGQTIGLITVTFGSVILGAIVAWALATLIDSYMRRLPNKGK